jgi:DNA modification methylase
VTPAPHYSDGSVTLYHGDCLQVMAAMPDNSIDAVVTDPPYLLGFMGRQWDTRAAHEHLDWHGAWATEAFRLLKPGGHLLAFGGTRTWHRLAVAIEDAGFEVRDSIAWLYGSGFPKSLDVSKAIDRAAGAAREVVGERRQEQGPKSITRRAVQSGHGYRPDGAEFGQLAGDTFSITTPATPAARQWQGWGTALKPAFEPVVVARKPLAGTVAANVLEHGTGALNVDGCRVPMSEEDRAVVDVRSGAGFGTGDTVGGNQGRIEGRFTSAPAGRWPTNVVLDEATAADLDQQTGDCVSRLFPRWKYEAKAPADERPRDEGRAHPTVKPLDLMRWLVRLVTPPRGLVLDPFAGSGTTAEACVIEGARCVTIEREAAYLPLIVARLSKPIQPDLFGLDA